MLEWAVIFFSKGSSWTRVQTYISHIADRFFTIEPFREAHHGNAGFIKCLEVFPLLHIFLLLICVFLFQLSELLIGFLTGNVWWLQIPSAFVGLGKSLSLLHFFMLALLGKVFLMVVPPYLPCPTKYFGYRIPFSPGIPVPISVRFLLINLLIVISRFLHMWWFFLVLLLSRFSLCPWFFWELHYNASNKDLFGLNLFGNLWTSHTNMAISLPRFETFPHYIFK